MKNIVVCVDGTDNQFSGDHTNVIRTYKVAAASPGQILYYDPGVGSLPLPGFWSKLGQDLSIVAGLAFGAGLTDAIMEAYRYLMRTYEAGDQIYLFGFSRGAFTVRALAAMIHAVGLLDRDSEQLVPYALRYWQSHRGPRSPGGATCDEFKATLARDCPIHFIGVWDTVSSVGLRNTIFHLSSFPITFHNPAVQHARHAVSIDERRCFFRQNLIGKWEPAQDVKNVWFAGVHSDVGGGYPAAESGLSKLAFEWMMAEAHHCGLKLDLSAADGAYPQQLALGCGPDPLQQVHDSLVGGWYLAEVLPTHRFSARDGRHHWRAGLGSARDVFDSRAVDGVFLHESVLQKFEGDAGYRPPNLPGSAAAIRATYQIEPRGPLV